MLRNIVENKGSLFINVLFYLFKDWKSMNSKMKPNNTFQPTPKGGTAKLICYGYTQENGLR